MTTVKKLFLTLPLLFALMLVPLAGCASQTPQADTSSASEASSAAAESSSDASSAAESSASSAASSVTYSEDVAAHGHLHVNVEIDASAAKAAGVDTAALETFASPVGVSVDLYGTAYDALVSTGLAIEGAPSYVTSIDGIGEGEAGASSGWMYEVNGETPMVAANEYVLQDGDLVRWYYSSWDE